MHEPQDSTRTQATGRAAHTASDGCLHHLFERQVARAGDRIALSDGSRTRTYEELNRAANRLAHRLRRRGAGPGAFVGVCSDRSADLVVALLAVLKSGAAYVPLDPAYPAERARFTLQDTGCRLVLGQERHRTAFNDTTVHYLAVETAADLDEPDTDPPSGVRADQPAYVIHTSGSTGTPKGVVVTHHNAVRLFDACRDDFAITPHSSDDVWTLFHSAAFDFSVWEMWGALLHGGRLVVVDYATSRSPHSFLRLLVDERVTVLSQTPTAFRQLIRAAEAEGHPDTALRLVVLGGEALEPATLRPWIDRYGDLRPRLVNMYGITETTVHVTRRDITAFDCDAPHSPIGQPLRDLRVHLLDAGLRPVPPGAVGEMYVGGAGVTLGYLNRPELTEQRFVPDPFGEPGDRLYRTGDLAVRRPNGDLDFRGRLDDQVQLRGFRIELGEVEAALAALDGVREAAVVLGEDPAGEPRLVGYAALAPGAPDTADALRRALAARLPAHMVPSVVCLLDSFPLTPNGKLDRRALPAPQAPARTGTAPASGTRPPEDARGTLEILHKIWAEALGRDTVEAHANFFALGGDSITAVRVVGMARDAGVPLTVEDLFTHPTLAALHAHHPGRQGRAPADDTPPAAEDPLSPRDRARLPADVTDAYPLTSLQLGMVFESQYSGDPTLYHDVVSARLEGPLDTGALRRALDLVAARHDILRSSFDLGGYDEPLQLVHAHVTVPLHTHPPAPAAGSAGRTVTDWWRQEWQRPFDFAAAPLWRCHVHDHADSGFQLSVSTHHSILDGWSFSLLLTELISAYERELTGDTTPLPPAGPPYRACGELERAARSSAAARQHWAGVVQGAPRTDLPAPAGDAAGTPSLEPDVRLTIPTEVVDAVQAGADRLGVPAKSVYLAAHLWALHAATGTREPTTGLVAHARPETADGERTLGLFLNSVPLRATVDGRTLQELVRAAFAQEQALLPHRRFPLADIRALAGRAPFDVLFNYTDFRSFDALDQLRGLRVSDWWFCDRTSFPVVVEVARQPRGADRELTVRADATKTDPSFCARLAPLFLDGLRRFCEEPADDR